MTLEIYDYLWIRNVLIALDAKDLASNIESIEEYKFVLKCMTNLLEHEDFALVFENSQDKILEFIQIFRFKYKDKDISDKTNFIIGKLNQYKTLSQQEKNLLIGMFYSKESQDRELPFLYKDSKEVIDCLIQNDIHIYRDIFCNSGTNTEPIPLTETDVIDYVALTNFIINRYSDFFENPNSINNTANNLNQLATIKALPVIIRMYIKKTLRKIKKADRKVKRLDF